MRMTEQRLLRVDLCLDTTRALCKHCSMLRRGSFVHFCCLRGGLNHLDSGGNEANYRTAAYEAITSYLTQATPDAITVVQSTVVAILQRMEHLLNMQNQILGVDDRNNWNELQSNFCSVVIVCFILISISLSCSTSYTVCHSQTQQWHPAPCRPHHDSHSPAHPSSG